MESEDNRRIREVLEMFGVEVGKVIGEWNLIGHLKSVVDIARKEENESCEMSNAIQNSKVH